MWRRLLLLLIAVPAAPSGSLRAAPSDPASVQALRRAGRAVVRVAVADLFLRPDPTGPLTDQARLGEALRVLTDDPDAKVDSRALEAAGLVRVETALAYRGYARARDLHPVPDSEPQGARDYGDPTAGDVVVVVARFANLYAQPDVTRQSPLLVAPAGARLRRRESGAPGQGGAPPGSGQAEPGRWLPIRLPDGVPAFVQSGDVAPLPQRPPQPTVACVLREAQRHEGTPYLWGGRSTYGIDCSGLVANAFSACGAPLPRDADLQAEAPILQKTSLAALQPGDLLFFGTKGPPRDRVTHVGIYLGSGEFLHATTAERPEVQRSPVAGPRWQRSFLLARRHPALGRP